MDKTLPKSEAPIKMLGMVQMFPFLSTSPTSGTTANLVTSLDMDKKTQTCPTSGAGATSVRWSGREPAELVAPLNFAIAPEALCSSRDTADTSPSAITAMPETWVVHTHKTSPDHSAKLPLSLPKHIPFLHPRRSPFLWDAVRKVVGTYFEPFHFFLLARSASMYAYPAFKIFTTGGIGWNGPVSIPIQLPLATRIKS